MNDEMEADNTDELIEAMKEGFVVRLADVETKLSALQRENIKLRIALGGLIGYASSVDVDNVPWVRELAQYIDRAMEAMGLEWRYVVVGGKIVKAGMNENRF